MARSGFLAIAVVAVVMICSFQEGMWIWTFFNLFAKVFKFVFKINNNHGKQKKHGIDGV